MRTLQAVLVHISRTPVLFIGVMAGFGLSAAALAWAGAQFASVTSGHETFDLQNRLTTSDIATQLPAYTQASRSAYALFAATDFAFPLLGSLFLGALIAFLLRNALPGIYTRLTQRHLLALALLPALLDWLENVMALLLINVAPGSDVLATLLLVCKQLKLVALMTMQLTVGVLLVSWLVSGSRRALHRLRSS